MLNGMLASLHYTLMLQLAVGCKILYYPVINSEVTTLNAMRGLLGTLAVLLPQATKLSPKPPPSEEDDVDLQITKELDYSVGPAILDVLHFGP